MSNETMNAIYVELKKKQTEDISQVEKYKALTAQLEDTVRERNAAITLLESGNNPEHLNKTLRQILNH